MAYDLNKIKIKHCSFCEEYYGCAEDELEFNRFLSKIKCDKCGAPLFGYEEDRNKCVIIKLGEKIGTICFDLSHASRVLQIQWEILGESYNRRELYYKVDGEKLLLYVADKFKPDTEWSVLTEDVVLNIRFNEIELYWQVTRRKYNISDDIVWALIAEKEQLGRIVFIDDNANNGSALLWLLTTSPSAQYVTEILASDTMNRGNSMSEGYDKKDRLRKYWKRFRGLFLWRRKSKNQGLFLTDVYGEKTVIFKEKALVGKGATCELRICDNTNIARIHAELSYHNGDWYICDLNSTNGTYHNGIKLSASKKYKLSANDKIRFANLEYTVSETEDREQLKKRIYEVRRRYREKEHELSNSGTEKDKEILKIMKDLIFDDLCYIKLDIELGLQILAFLGYSKEEAKNMYAELTTSAYTSLNKGRYTIVSNFRSECDRR